MDDSADYRSANIKKRYVQDFPKGILDIIQSDYPGKYFLMLDDRLRIAPLFSNEEWIDILTKSRNSYRKHTVRLNSTSKYSAHGNRAEIG